MRSTSPGNSCAELQAQFGNLGLAAAAYNAGPRRVTDWMAKRGALPGETRNYVVRITGRQAEQWTSSEFARDPEAALMPAKAPCAEVAEAVAAQGKIVRVAKLMAELAAADQAAAARQADDKFDEAAWKVASARPELAAACAESCRRGQEHPRAGGAQGWPERGKRCREPRPSGLDRSRGPDEAAESRRGSRNERAARHRASCRVDTRANASD